MNKHTLSVSLVAFGIVASLAPVSGFAYITPQEAFTPPNAREGAAKIEQQQAVSAERRAAEYAALNPVEPEPEVIVEKAPPLGLLNDEETYNRRLERMAEEKSNGPTIIITGGNTITDSSGRVLHSGAPRVTATGPESVLAFGALLLAGVSTYAYASIRSKRMTALS